MKFYGYKKCSTCRNAHKFLADHGIETVFHDFVVNPPTEGDIEAWVNLRGEGVTPFLNVKGTSYKEQGLADKRLSDGELINLMSRDGKLIKRPILVLDDRVLIGFNKEEYSAVAKGRT